MLVAEQSMTAWADVLPFADATDLAERFDRLNERLRDAPVTGDGSEIFDLAWDAFSTLAGDPATGARAMCLLMISRNKYLRGLPFDGIEPANQAVAVAERINDDLLLAKCLKLLGLMYAETGNFPAAMTFLTRALPIARRAQDSDQESGIFANLGLAHQYAGQFSLAIPCYERAVEVAGSDAKVRLSQVVPLVNIAIASLYLRDFSRGLAAAERAIELLADPRDDSERMTRGTIEFAYTRLLLEVRNIPLAVERAKLARLHSKGAGALGELYAEMALGLAEVHDPATCDIGLSRLQRAINDSRRGVPSALRDALATIVRAYEVAKQPNNALVFQEEVVRLNRDSRVKNLLEHHHRHVVQVKKALDARAEAAMDLQQHELRFQRFSMQDFGEFTQVLERNSVTVEFHDDETGEHCYRVGAMARELARKMGLDEELCQLIDLCARLHDVGKIRIPESILLKPGRFTPDERAIMERHCEFGWEIIGEGGLGQLFVAQEIAFNHHEKWDGSGYPRKIRGEMIPLSARIVALSDVYDALTHRRSYKEAWPIEDALRHIGGESGKHFDPQLTAVFLGLVPELQAQHGNLDAFLSAEAKKNDFIINRARLARELNTDIAELDVRR
ncbi:MAG: HD domain-containing phosphohydrolase [Burkholderiaceae bacterium]